MKVCFTGTQQGMTEQQRKAVWKWLCREKPESIVHGDCIGADAQMHDMAVVLKIPTFIRPCTVESKRAFCPGGTVLNEPMPPLERNQIMVADVATSGDGGLVDGCVVATPKEFREERRSGTWSTIRHGRKSAVPVFIFFPDGELEVEKAYK